MSSIIIGIILAGIALFFYSKEGGATETTAPVPTGNFETDFQAAIRAAGGLQGLPYDGVYTQCHLETGGGTSEAYLKYHNGFGFHAVGPANTFWDGKTTYTTSVGEVLRVYPDLASSIGDYIRLITSKYPAAAAFGREGSISGFFQGLQDGGYGPSDYAARLKNRYIQLYGKATV